MCGIVGVIGNISSFEMKEFHKLLMFDQVRGAHSTGVALIGTDNQPSLHKKVGGVHNLMDSIAYNKAIADVKPRVVIGHNRYATQGEVNEANAHPFHIGHIVGAHNGTLYNKSRFKGEAGDHPVDSYMLYNLIAEQGIEEAVARMNEVTDAYSLVWYNQKDQTFNMLRNEKRPMWFARSHDCMFFASEEWMLKGIQNDTTAPQFHTSGKLTFKDGVAPTKEDMLITVPFEGKTIGKPTIRPLKQQIKTYVYTGWQNGTIRGGADNITSTKSSATVTHIRKEVEQGSQAATKTQRVPGKLVEVLLDCYEKFPDKITGYTLETPDDPPVEVVMFQAKRFIPNIEELITTNAAEPLVISCELAPPVKKGAAHIVKASLGFSFVDKRSSMSVDFCCSCGVSHLTSDMTQSNYTDELFCDCCIKKGEVAAYHLH